MAAVAAVADAQSREGEVSRATTHPSRSSVDGWSHFSGTRFTHRGLLVTVSCQHTSRDGQSYTLLAEQRVC